MPITTFRAERNGEDLGYEFIAYDVNDVALLLVELGFNGIVIIQEVDDEEIEWVEQYDPHFDN